MTDTRESNVAVPRPTGAGRSVVDTVDASYTYAGGRKHPGRTIGPLSLSIRSGERLAIIGPNGCGKSTLVNLLCGASTPAVGEVRWFGESSAAEVRRRIGVVFQSPSLDALLTVRETLHLAGRLLQVPSAAIRERTGALAEDLGISDRLDHRVGTLSGGLARRVDLARAVLHRPELLLLDEPTAGLDDESASAFNAMLDRLVRAGVAIVAATHTLEEVVRSHRVIVMVDGTIAIDEPATDSVESGDGMLSIRTDNPALAQRFERLGLLRESHDRWTLDPSALPGERVSAALLAAVELKAHVTSEERSIQRYFERAQREVQRRQEVSV